MEMIRQEDDGRRVAAMRLGSTVKHWLTISTVLVLVYFELKGVSMMQAEHEIVLTASGMKKIEDELERLKTTYRKRIADRIREAMEHGGDLTDNTEYEEAKNEQGMVEGRIEELRQIVGAARVLEMDEVLTDEVSVGSIVKVRDLESNDEWEWTIVGTFEADPGEDRISDESPVGEALVGKRVGETAEVEIPAGTVRYTVLGIRK